MTPDKVEAALGALDKLVLRLMRTGVRQDLLDANAINTARSTLGEALAERERDAARYRWLRDFAHPDADSSGVAVTEQWFTDWGRPYTHHFSGDQLDTAIDAAMKETP